jgi:prophage tail gpP-like protein
VSVTLAADPDDVAIVVGSTQFKGWQTVSITRSVETMPNSFVLTASTEYMQDSAALAGTRPGQACQIKIGSDLVITGWIDRRSISADARSHQVALSGRGITRNLVDCSADLVFDPTLFGGSVTAASTLALAQRLSKAYGVTVRSAVADRGPDIPAFQIQLGETPYQIIESVAHYTGYLVYEDEYGALVLDRVGTQSMASGFTMPGNIEAISAERSVDGRFSDYVVVSTSVAQLSEIGVSNIRAQVNDTTFHEHRVRIMVSNQITPAFDVAEMMANWEFARRIGRCQAAQITCDTWRDEDGLLWTPNRFATIEAPLADITGANWIIGSVTLRKDTSGTHADLVLMPPEAFMPEPNPLNLFNAELVAKTTPKQDPAPPATSPASGI